MHEMAWVGTERDQVLGRQLQLRILCVRPDMMHLHVTSSLPARLAVRLPGQVFRSNAGPLARAADFKGLKEPAEEVEHHALPSAVLKAITAALNAAAWAALKPVPNEYILRVAAVDAP